MLNSLENLLAQFGVNDLSSPKQNPDPKVTARLKKLLGVFHFKSNVVFINKRAEPYFLDVNDVLFFPAVFFLLTQLIFVFAVIHDPTNRRLRIGSHFDQIQIAAFGQGQGFNGIQDSQLSTVRIDYPDLFDLDAFVDPNVVFFNGSSSLRYPPGAE
jgi:hypothetical protein